MATDIATPLLAQSLTLETKPEARVQQHGQMVVPTAIGTFELPLFQKSCSILDIIYRYRLDKPSSPSLKCTLRFAAQLYDQVRESEPIRMCLPAFPFKSPNKQSKVLGRLPDKAEEFALAHINGLCAAIGDVYPPGAELTIISDGLVYNDLLGVPDKDVWAYGQSLRALAVAKNFKHIRFARLNDLLHNNLPQDDEMAYVANASEFRHLLLSNFGRPDFDSSLEISTNEDTCLTYRGYLKFLETDLESVYPLGPERSRKMYKKGVSNIAKQMLARGDAFARAIRERFPDHIRLSIHPSKTGRFKIPIRLLPTSDHNNTWSTPWHCALAVAVDGGIRCAPRGHFDASPEVYELVIDDHGNASYYREKSDLFSWTSPATGQPVDVYCDPVYPCGIIVRPALSSPGKDQGSGKKQPAPSIRDVDPLRLRGLAERNSPVVLRGFSGGDERELFLSKAREIGEPMPWRFGILLEVKDKGEEGRGSANSLSAESMPFHYDGVFKTVKRVVEGKEVDVPAPPRLQFFTAVTPSPPDTGYTLFASSNLVFQHLPGNLSLDMLKRLTFSVSTTSFDQVTLDGLPMVVLHHVTGKPCLRYHEIWPQSKTNFEPIDVTIERDGVPCMEIAGPIEKLLYDRRVTYWHAWEKGDLLLSDNTSMLHTRSAFESGCERELWRVHLD